LRELNLTIDTLDEVAYVLNVYSALRLFLECQEEHPACKKLSDEVLVWLVICLEPGANDLHIMAQLMPLPPHGLLLP